MATSGSTDFNINRDAIIRQALLKLRKVDAKLSVGPQDITDGALSLNLMIKSWQTDDVRLWLNEEVVLHQQYNTQFYSLGPSGDHCALLSDAGKTQLSAASAASDTTLEVDSITGIADADTTLVQLDAGTIHADTVNGSPSGSTVTVTTGVASAAAIDNWVFHYTNKIARPLQITEARVRDTDDVDTTLHIETSRNEFLSITDKTTNGRVQVIHYNPDITNGQLYVWPICGTGDITDRIVMTIQRVIEDFDAQANNFDGPVEALGALIWNLAAWMAPEYGVDLTSGKGAGVFAMAKTTYNALKNFYSDREPVYLRP